LAKIDSIVRISGGVLLNTPSIDSIEEIQISSSKVKRGDLFIDLENSIEDLHLAVSNGAYAVLTSSIPEIFDEEIAWIRTNDLEKSLVKLARFYAIDKNFRFIPLLNVHYALAKSLHVESGVKLLSNTTSDALVQILNSKNKTIFFVGENSFIENIDPSIKKLPIKINPDKLFENGLFYSSFIYKDMYIKETRLSSFFIPYLCALMDYCDELSIEYKIDNFLNLGHFEPQFVTSKLEKVDFGTTRKAVIFEENMQLYNEELKYLYERVERNLIETDIKYLITKNFRYALINGKKEDFDNLFIDKKTVQLELF